MLRIILNVRQRLTETQFEKVGQLYRVVAGIADGLGSENTDSGHVLPCAQLTFSQARRAMFPKGYEFESYSAAKWKSEFGSQPGVSALLSFATTYKPEFGLVGDPDRFHPNESDRGNFWVCVYLKSRRALGHNMLIRFERTET